MVYYPLALECNKPATPTLTISITSTNPQNHTIAHFSLPIPPSLGKPLSALLIELPTHNTYYTAHNPPPSPGFSLWISSFSRFVQDCPFPAIK